MRIAAYAVVAAFFCWGFVLRVSPSVMTAELMRDFAVGAGALGQLSALYYYAYAGMQVPVGVLLDRIGPRRLLTAAVLTAATGALVFAMADGLLMAGIGRALIGVGCAFSWVGVLTVIARSFPQRLFARLAGFAQCCGVGGAVLGQAPLGLLVIAVGWRTSLASLATIGAVLAACGWLAWRETARQAAPVQPGAQPRLLDGLRFVARNRQTWIAAAFGFFMSTPLQGFSALWAVPYYMTRFGVDRESAAMTATLMSVGYACAAPLIGIVADRIGRRRTMLAGSVACTLLMLAIIFVPGLSLGIVRLLMFLAGVSTSVMFLAFVCGREHNPPAMTGAAMGIVNTAVMAAGALFQPLIGLLLDAGWAGEMVDGARRYPVSAYTVGLIVVPLCGIAGLMAAWFLREPPPASEGKA